MKRKHAIAACHDLPASERAWLCKQIAEDLRREAGRVILREWERAHPRWWDVPLIDTGMLSPDGAKLFRREHTPPTDFECQAAVESEIIDALESCAHGASVPRWDEQHRVNATGAQVSIKAPMAVQVRDAYRRAWDEVEKYGAKLQVAGDRIHVARHTTDNRTYWRKEMDAAYATGIGILRVLCPDAADLFEEIGQEQADEAKQTDSP